jgi:hypothetical protein
VVRLFADENFPLPAVDALRRLDHDVVTLQEAGYGGQAITDPDVLRLATTHQRALLTINRRHFIQLHKTSISHAGIIVCTFDADFAALATRIHTAIAQHVSLVQQLVRINRPQA